MTKSTDTLIRYLYDKNPETRSRAAMDLGEREAVEAISSLTKVLGRDDDPSVRSVCAEALGRIGDSEAVEDLVVALETEENERVRLSLNWALKTIANKLGKTVEELVEEETTKRTGIIDKTGTSTTQEPRETDKPKEFPIDKRSELLRKIIERYDALPLEKMTKLLQFERELWLEEWLLDLPDELAFQIKERVVHFPDNLKTTKEKEDYLEQLIESFESYFEEKNS